MPSKLEGKQIRSIREVNSDLPQVTLLEGGFQCSGDQTQSKCLTRLGHQGVQGRRLWPWPGLVQAGNAQ